MVARNLTTITLYFHRIRIAVVRENIHVQNYIIACPSFAALACLNCNDMHAIYWITVGGGGFTKGE